MYNKVVVVPERSRFRDLAGMDVIFLALLGVIAIGIFIGIMMHK